MAEDSTRRLLRVFGMAVTDSEDARSGPRDRASGESRADQVRAREALVAAVRARGAA